MTDTIMPGSDKRAKSPCETVSIVIPARNEEDYVTAALASVAAQRYPLLRIEIVVVDNGSSDRTAEVAGEFASLHPDLAIDIVGEPAEGVARAKNTGARAAQGDILLFLDADSRLDPDLVATVAAHYRAGCPAGSIKVVADSGDLLERGFFSLMEVGKVLFGIRAQMFFCDRSLFLALAGFDPTLMQAEDLEFLKRVRRHLRGSGSVLCHVRRSAIRTSPRRLRQLPLRLGLIMMLLRWALAFAGVGRTRRY